MANRESTLIDSVPAGDVATALLTVRHVSAFFLAHQRLK